MNIQDKTRAELINELQELQQAFNALKVSAEADSIAQKQTMAALQASEERFQLLFNKAPLGYQSLDFGGNFIEVNQQWLDTLGYKREEVIGKWFGDFLTPAYQDGFRKRFPIFKELGKIHSEFEMVHKNGSVLFIAFDGRIGYDDKGDFKQTHCILQDITEIKHAERALSESEEKYRLLHENAGVGIGYYKVDGTIISYNNIAAKNMNGVPEDFKGKSIYDFFPESVAQFFHERIKKAAVSEIPVTYEDEVDLPTGNKYFISTYTRITNTDGEIEGIQVLSHDISDRRQAEAALKESEENLATTLHSIGDAVISTDRNGLVIQMNPVAETLCGWKLTDASGKPLAEVFTIINDETRQTVADPVKKVLEKGEIVGLANHTILVSRNGTEYQISDSAAPIKNKEGEISGVVLVFSDITRSYIAQKQIKESEERYRSLLNNLEAGIVVHAPDTSITMNNHRASELLGLSNDQMRGKAAIEKAWKFIHEDNRPLTLDEYPVNRIVTGRQPIRNQVLGIRQPGENNVVWVNVNGFPVLNDSGEITEIVISFIDITESKKAEQAILETENLYRKMNENSPLGMHFYQLNSNNQLIFVGANPAADQLLGADHNQFIGKTIEEAFPPLIQTEVPEKYRNAAKNGILWSTEQIVYNDNRISGAFEVRAFQTTPGNMVAIFADITERKQSEQIIQEKTEEIEVQNEELNQANQELTEANKRAEESEANLKAAMENSQAGIAIAEVPTGKLKYVNKAGLLIRGREYDEIVKDIDLDQYVSSWQILHFDGTPYQSDEVPLARAILYGEKSSREFIVRRDNNEDRYVWANAAPIYNAQGIQTSAIVVFLDITDRIQAEEKLRKSEEQNKAIVQSTPDHIIMQDKDLKYILVVNPQMGLTEQDMLGKTDYDFLSKEDADNLTIAKTRVMETGEPLHFETSLISAYGKKEFFDGAYIPTFDAHAEPSGLIGYFRNVTERKQAEKALNMLASSFVGLSGKAFFEAISKHIATEMGIDYVYVGELTDTKDSVRVIGGFALGEAMGEMLYNLTDTPCSDVINNDTCLYSTGIQQHYPKDYLLKQMGIDGYLGHRIYNKEQEPIGLLVALHSKPLNNPDILGNLFSIFLERIAAEMHRMRADDALYKSEAIKNTMVSNIGDVIVIIDQNGINQYKSPNIATLFGWQPEELVGKSTWDNVHADDLDAARKFIAALATEPNAKGTTEIRYKRKDGRYVWIEITVANLLSDPYIRGFLGNYHDISDRKKAEQELIIAKDHAEESDRLKSAFLANMSHEIRTPMNGILGFAELLKEPDLSGEEQKEYIKIIEKSGNRMLNTINEIVEISKIESGLMKLDIKESNINEQIEYIYTFFKPEVEAKSIKISFINSLTAKAAIIKTDREKVYSILTNLVKNAIKYTVKGSIEFGYDLIVETGHAQSLTQKSFLQFYVKDTGIGIPSDRQVAIFERFIQADISDKMARQGAGLGLSISKAYVEMLGGKIWVESEEGVGSAFYFTIPYNAEPEEKAFEKIVTAQDEENQIKPEISGLKILIAEDDETSEMLITINVGKFGKEILKAVNGFEAVEICRNNPDIDLILMDILMPEMGGYEATYQIRKFNKEVVIIAQTAYGLSGDREKAIEAGCNDYIAKPIKKEELLALIQKYFNR